MRLAIDTNVVARLLISDDEDQAHRLVQYLEADLFVPVSVIVESEWLLRSSFGLDREMINTQLRAFMAFPNVEVSESAAVRLALDLMNEGSISPMLCTSR